MLQQFCWRICAGVFSLAISVTAYAAPGESAAPVFPPDGVAPAAADEAAAPQAPAAAPVAPAAPAVQQAYVGSNQCFTCHRPQTDTWYKTKHPEAFTNLPKKYQNDAACLKCHVTAFGEPEGFVAGTQKDLLMVGCETCHGPGALHVAAAQRFILANPGEEAAIEKEMRDTVVRTPPDSVCAKCHTVQAHGHHPAYEGQPASVAVRRAPVQCCAATAGAVVAKTGSVPAGHASRYSVKTCGGCHYDQYLHWGGEKHSALKSMVPAKYLQDESCLVCHTESGANLAASQTAADASPHRIGVSCESCHGAAMDHVRFTKQFISGPPLGSKLEHSARDSIRGGRPAATCVQCHIGHGHKEHPAFDKPETK